MINYIILAHKNPKQVARLVRSLLSEEVFFYIHICKSADINPFIIELKEIPNVLFLAEEKRCFGTWGGFGITKATINAIREVLNDRRGGMCVLLSGQDYPIKNNQSIQVLFSLNPFVNFIDCFPLPNEIWAPEGGLDRLNKYRINLSNKRWDFLLLPSVWEKGFYNKLIISKIKRLLQRGKLLSLFKVLKQRKHPTYLKPYGASQWWALPVTTLKKIIGFLDVHPDFLKYHKDTLLSDEIVIPSIVIYLSRNDATMLFRHSVTYVNWSRPHVQLPVTFNSSDYLELINQPEDVLFARKFDVDFDERILQLIDIKNLNNKSTH